MNQRDLPNSEKIAHPGTDRMGYFSHKGKPNKGGKVCSPERVVTYGNTSMKKEMGRLSSDQGGRGGGKKHH